MARETTTWDSQLNSPTVSIVIPCHQERPAWIRRAIRSVTKQIEPPDFEIIIVADRADTETRLAAVAELDGNPGQVIDRDFGDLGPSRNAGIALSRGRFIALLDGDDAFGCRWLRQAFEYARRFEDDNFALHVRWNIFFGKDGFSHYHYGDDDPEFDAKNFIQYNQWSALAFAPKTLFEKFPYRTRNKRHGNEDWGWAVETLGAGVRHRCVPDSVHMLRLKGDMTSLAARVSADRATIGKHALFARRDLPDARKEIPSRIDMPVSVFSQVQFAHFEIGEYRLFLTPEMPSRIYPHQKIWNDAAWLRDQIGDARHLVLVERLVRGGAEKYAMNWAKALQDAGESVVIIETGIGDSPWKQQANHLGLRVIQWERQRQLQPPEEAMAMQQAIIQTAPKSTFVCNSSLGWLLVHENHRLLGDKVIVANFSDVPEPAGFSRCPAYYLENMSEQLTILTDNDRQAGRLCKFHDMQIGRNLALVPPLATYEGKPKFSRRGERKMRVLWAGRGTVEKQPGMIPHLASAMRDRAEFHVWGDVQPIPHALDNLHYRGPFDGFDKIEGTYDCLLLTSGNEGMPNIALEATLAGLPIVSSDVGGIPLLTKYLFPVHNVPAERQLAGAIAQLDAFHKAKSIDVATPRDTVIRWANDFPKRVLQLCGVSNEVVVDSRSGPGVSAEVGA